MVQAAPVERKIRTLRENPQGTKAQRSAKQDSVVQETSPIKQEIQQIEKLLEAKEARKKEIENLMADPAIYEKREVVVPLLEEDPVWQKKLKGWNLVGRTAGTTRGNREKHHGELITFCVSRGDRTVVGAPLAAPPFRAGTPSSSGGVASSAPTEESISLSTLN